MPFEFRLLSRADDRSNFRSGDAALDHYFVRFAGQNHFRHRMVVTYVAVEASRILGFMTVVPTEVSGASVSLAARKHLPNYPVPALRLARLAVDADVQGQGVGTALLRACFDLSLRMRDELGCVGMVVDAKPDALAFYQRYGFTPLDPESGHLGDRPAPIPMFLPIAAIAGAP